MSRPSRAQQRDPTLKASKEERSALKKQQCYGVSRVNFLGIPHPHILIPTNPQKSSPDPPKPPDWPARSPSSRARQDPGVIAGPGQVRFALSRRNTSTVTPTQSSLDSATSAEAAGVRRDSLSVRVNRRRDRRCTPRLRQSLLGPGAWARRFKFFDRVLNEPEAKRLVILPAARLLSNGAWHLPAGTSGPRPRRWRAAAACASWRWVS